MIPPSESGSSHVLPIPSCPFHTWGIDLVGPSLLVSRDTFLLLTMVDHHSRWSEAIPVSSKQFKTIHYALSDVFSHTGIPSVLLSDNGMEFTEKMKNIWANRASAIISHPLIILKVTEGCSIPIKPCRTCSLGCPKVVHEWQWSAVLPETMYAHRIAVDPTSTSPYEAVRVVHSEMVRIENLKIHGFSLSLHKYPKYKACGEKWCWSEMI